MYLLDELFLNDDRESEKKTWRMGPWAHAYYDANPFGADSKIF